MTSVAVINIATTGTKEDIDKAQENTLKLAALIDKGYTLFSVTGTSNVVQYVMVLEEPSKKAA